ncbi:hypothetical protein F0562_025074 [Nyssa sinensis]|uniref:WPP domain-containing protein n=1 Tax=Nyssa sinensis TaxID=561372 RepID=A0A5J5BJ02_9ASTE|nr:hypothetical protein F0562_025074 [Nyssa sinensis]
MNQITKCRDSQVLLEHFLRITLYKIYLSSAAYANLFILYNIYPTLEHHIDDDFMATFHLKDIGNYGGALGADGIAKGLEGNKSLRELHLHGNSIGDEEIRALMSGKLLLLDIGNNAISSKGAQKIAEALKQNCTRITIDLGGNNIHAKGASDIAQVLKDNSVIVTLELRYNPIGPNGAKALSEVLKFHGKINTLNLDRSKGDDGAIWLARSLKVVDEAMTSLDLAFHEIRDEGHLPLLNHSRAKANEDVRITSLNLGNKFLTRLGQSALIDARDHVYEMNEKEVNVFF